MARIAVVGDGPAGLSAALFLAKNGHDTVVFGDDESLVEYAEFHNYLGMPDQSGPEFMDTARQQVGEVGATLRDGTVEAVRVAGDTVTVTPTDGDGVTVDYVVVAGGKASQALVADAGGEVSDGAVVVDGNSMTTVDRVYAAGHLVRPDRSQAVISAGMGAAAAIDIISREADAPVHDWDSPD